MERRVFAADKRKQDVAVFGIARPLSIGETFSFEIKYNSKKILYTIKRRKKYPNERV